MEQNIPQGEAGGQSTSEAPVSSAPTNNANTTKGETKNMLSQLEAILDEYMVTKAPFALPLGLKEFIATVSPYLIIVFAVLALPFILFALGLSAVLAPLGMMGGYGYNWGFGGIVSLAVALAAMAMEVMAVPGLFKRTKGAWRLLFYVSVINLVGSLLAMNIVGGIIGAIIGWYILFQMKDMYKN
ncbi:MAG: hypothetical protein WCG73_01720 [Candidatus Moraniibacteriota bacterium]